MALNTQSLDVSGEQLVAQSGIGNFTLGYLRKLEEQTNAQGTFNAVASGVASGASVDETLNTAGRLYQDQQDMKNPDHPTENPMMNADTAFQAGSGQQQQQQPGYGAMPEPTANTEGPSGESQTPVLKDPNAPPENQRARIMTELENLRSLKPDSAGYLEAEKRLQKAYESQAGIKAPEMEHSQPNLAAQIMSGIAILANPNNKYNQNVANAPYAAAKQHDQEKYAADVQKYNALSSQAKAEVEAARAGLSSEQWKYIQEQNHNDKATEEQRKVYTDILASMDRTDATAQRAEALNFREKSAAMKALDNEVTHQALDIHKAVLAKGKYDKEMDDSIIAWAQKTAASNPGVTAQELYDRVVKYQVGDTTLAQRQADQKNEEAKKKDLVKSKDENSKALQAYIKTAMSQVGGWTEDNDTAVSAWLEGLPKEVRPSAMIPSLGESYQEFESRQRRAESIRHNKTSEAIAKENAGTNANRLKETNRHNVVTEGQGQQRLNNSKGKTEASGTTHAKIKQFGGEFVEAMGGKKKGWRVEQDGPGSIPGSLHKSGLALDLIAPKNDPAELEKALDYAKSRKVPYIIYNGLSYSLYPNGNGYRVKKYTGPSPHTDHVHIDWKGEAPTDAEKAKISAGVTKGINDAYASNNPKSSSTPKATSSGNSGAKAKGGKPVKLGPYTFGG